MLIRRLALLLAAVVGVGAIVVLVVAPRFDEDCRPEREPGHSMARIWNEELLEAIRRDFPAPTVHARNLHHLSALQWDVWASLDGRIDTVLVAPETEPPPLPDDTTTARETEETAIAYASYRLLISRYEFATGADITAPALAERLESLCLDPDHDALEPGSAGRFGVDAAEQLLRERRDDGSDEASGYRDLSYVPWNPPLVVDLGEIHLPDPDRWQPLALEDQRTQNDVPIPAFVQEYIGPHWGFVEPFALDRADDGLPIDPGPPPLFADDPDAYADAAMEVLEFGALLDTDSPETVAIGGTEVLLADYGRVVAEYWADGPDSETPPGHWNTLAFAVSDRLAERGELRLGGDGPELDRLEWDLAVGLTLNGALHDAAIAAWGAKAHYDYVRPISMIRWLSSTGDLPLVEGLSEVITEATAAPGGRHEELADHVGQIAVWSWRGQPEDTSTTVSGVGWILGTGWVPYQRSSFVTPSFAAYVSGHSTFSRAAADVLAALVGSEVIPGGPLTWTVESLIHEAGPTEPVTLSWTTFGDAAEEAGLSRLYGGIHVLADHTGGRLIGAEVARAAVAEAEPIYASAATRWNSSADSGSSSGG
ncbi:MAG: hypothetical protein AAGD18_09845 [Actinomycetota bacterium]